MITSPLCEEMKRPDSSWYNTSVNENIGFMVINSQMSGERKSVEKEICKRRLITSCQQHISRYDLQIKCTDRLTAVFFIKKTDSIRKK
jgi:hypothetical protein